MRRKAYLVFVVAALLLALPLAAQADYVYQTINGSFSPGPYYWVQDGFGWDWTPATNVELTGVQTQLETGFSNINNNFTVTATLYSARPTTANPTPTVLGSFTFNGLDYVDGPWQGGTFGTPVSLTGGTGYFLGFSGWLAVLNPGVGGGGVIMVGDDPHGSGMAAAGTTALQGYNEIGGLYNDPGYALGSWPNTPILRFTAANPVPLPGTLPLVLSGIGALAFWRRRCSA